MIEYKLTELARVLNTEGIDVRPTRGSSSSAGFDLYACLKKEVVIHPGYTESIPSGLHIFLKGDKQDTEQGVVNVGLCVPRSSIKGLILINTIGVLDEDYQGEWVNKLFNLFDSPITVFPGDRLVQMVIVQANINSWKEVDYFSTITERGENGFGSTGR